MAHLLSFLSSSGSKSKEPLPGSPIKEPSPKAPTTESPKGGGKKPLRPTLKVPVDKPCSRFPNRSLYKKRCLSLEPFLLSKSPVDKPYSRFPNRSLYKKKCPSPEPFLLSKSPVDEPSFRFPKTGAPIA
jgi:hypothetical protein